MKLNKITQIQMQIIINENLYKNNYIDEMTYLEVNNKLLKDLRLLQVN